MSSQDPFAFHPPSLSPSSHYPETSNAPFSHARPSSSSSPADGAPTTNGHFRSLSYGADPAAGNDDDAAEAAERRDSFGGDPRPSSDSPPSTSTYGTSTFTHSVHGTFPQAPFPGHGVNVRNTRPMTAPSSVSAPYFGAAHYSPTQPTVSSSFYAPPQYLSNPIPRNTFQYSVDSGAPTAVEHDHDGGEAVFRARNFSLPELVGLNSGGGGLPDEPRYASGGGSPPSTFFYGVPPPRAVKEDELHHAGGPPRPTAISGLPPHHALSSSPEQSYDSRPTTGDSHTTSSSHTTVGPPGSFVPPGHISGYHHQSMALREQLPPPPPPPHGGAQHHGADGKVYNFIQQAGQSTKRPRRRYDEIERLYDCNYPGCTKAYGTLNHLNSHKTMQKHGPRSTPAAEFKDRRKAWREGKKREAAAAAARAAEQGLDPTTVNGKPKSASDPIRPTPRPRPSTSAGEYSYIPPTPFMSSVGAPHASYALPPPPPSSAVPYLESQAQAATATTQPEWYPGHTYEQPSYHGVRPLTAPSYYSNVVPAFGFTHAQVNGGGSPHLSNGFGGVDHVGGGRRMSLPGGGQFGFSHDQRFPSISEEYDPHAVVGGRVEDERKTVDSLVH
ncbi:zinc finger, C2H4-type domain containing protein [Pseudohyphozyma bogoriensis]|nr:zinc finger, C2H4-type domain containing protein [Pseudohyphozyma bogoriensis]